MDAMSTPDPATSRAPCSPPLPSSFPGRLGLPGEDQYGDRAYEFAKWAILSAVYPAGTVITEAELAHEIGLTPDPGAGGVPAAGGRRGWSGSSRAAARWSAPSRMHEVEDVLEARVLVENHTAAKLVRPPRAPCCPRSRRRTRRCERSGP